MCYNNTSEKSKRWEREKERRIKSGHLVLTSYTLQLSYHLNQIKILTSFNCDCLLIGFAFSDAPSLVALKAEEKILNFSKSPTHLDFSIQKDKRLNILCASRPIHPFPPEQPSHLWSNEFEKKKRNIKFWSISIQQDPMGGPIPCRDIQLHISPLDVCPLKL